MEEEHLEERLQVLKMLEAGQIGAEEAAMLLAAIDSTETEVEEQPPLPQGTPVTHRNERWARFWIYPLMAGGIVLIVGSVVMGLVYATDAARGWLVCAWLPMILGMIVIVLAWWSRQARWMHLRISEQGKRKIAFSFPLPLGLAAWGLRIAQPFVPQLKETGVDDLIIALRDSTTQDEPFFVDVQDDENGERVELYIG
jgi:hypothetical protein